MNTKAFDLDIEIKNLCKSYGSKKVLSEIDFSVKRGSVMGFLGANGAGKSTTMNILTGYISSDKGAARILGKDILSDPKAVKKNIGYLPEIPPVYPDMTVFEYLNFVYDLKKIKENRKEHIDEIIKKVKIDAVRTRLIKNLSKGYRQRVGLAQALIGNPRVLILDEPTVGLDPVQIIEFRSIIKSLKGDHTIILSTHILQEVTAVCDSVTIINGGKVVVSDTLSSLSDGENLITVKISGSESAAKAALTSLSGVKITSQKCAEAGVSLFELSSSRDIRKEVFDAVKKTDMAILELKNTRASLEELFTRVTTSEVKAEKGGEK